MMRDRCEASGLRVKPNADGRGHCPLCGDDWHCLTNSNALRQHQRIHAATPEQVEAVLHWKEHEPGGDAGLWPGWPVSALR